MKRNCILTASILFFAFLMSACTNPETINARASLVENAESNVIHSGSMVLDSVLFRTTKSCLRSYFRNSDVPRVVNIYFMYKCADIVFKHSKDFCEKSGIDLLIDKSEWSVIYSRDSLDKPLRNFLGGYNAATLRALSKYSNEISNEFADYLCDTEQSTFKDEAIARIEDIRKN